MTYFILSITIRCNKDCPYCVAKPYLNNPDYPDKASAKDFIGFLEKEFKPGDVVELTGGEPTLFPGLEALLGWLQEHGAKIILRTNGFRLGEWRRNYDNLVVVLARHGSGDDYMAERRRHLLPQDMVLESIPDAVRQREGGAPIFVQNEESPIASYPFTRAFFVSNGGQVQFMPCCKKDMGTVWDYKPRVYYCCPECAYMLGAWNLASRIGRG